MAASVGVWAVTLFVALIAVHAEGLVIKAALSHLYMAVCFTVVTYTFLCAYALSNEIIFLQLCQTSVFFCICIWGWIVKKHADRLRDRAGDDAVEQLLDAL